MTIKTAQGIPKAFYFDAHGQSVKVSDIQNAVASVAGITVADLSGKTKDPLTVLARRVAYWLLRRMRHMSYAGIGKEFGRDHSTIVSELQRLLEIIDLGDERYRYAAAILDSAVQKITDDHAGDLEELVSFGAFGGCIVSSPNFIARGNGISADPTLFLDAEGGMVPVNEIIYRCCKACGTNPSMFQQYPQWSECVDASRLAAWLLRKLRRMSYPQISDALGKSSHSTVVAGMDRTVRMLVEVPEFADKLALVVSDLEKIYPGASPSVTELAMHWEVAGK